MPSENLISVLMPVYNGSAYIKEAITSILDQDAEFELVVADDCSTDDTCEIVSSFNDPRIKLIRNNRNLGIFGNLNSCIAEAKGKFLQVFSQDDLMFPGYLQSQRDFLTSHPEAALVYGRPNAVPEPRVNPEVTTDCVDKTPEIIHWPLYLWISSHYGALPASISSIMFLRKVVEMEGGFDSSFQVAGDVEFYHRVGRHFALGYNKEARHYVRTHSGMKTVQEGTGALYLEEERRLHEWLAPVLSAREQKLIGRFRAQTRGVFHLSWICRAFKNGKVKESLKNLHRFHKLYPLHWAIYGIARHILGGGAPARPYLAPPANVPITDFPVFQGRPSL